MAVFADDMGKGDGDKFSFHTAMPSFPKLTLLIGDCLEQLRTVPDKSARCCVTSPPYFGLRDYGHPGQIGLEDTPAAYVEKLLRVFAEVRRVLTDDGTLWLNLGDSYSAHPGQRKTTDQVGLKQQTNVASSSTPSRCVPDLAAKQLIGIPWRVAFALQADGWWLRSEIIWAKKQCMPESVTDRPTKSHEQIFLLAKSADYYYDHEAIKEPCQSGPSDVKKMLEAKERIDAKHFHEDSGILAAASHRTNIGNKRGVGGSVGKNEQSGNRLYSGFNARWDAKEAKNLARREGDLTETRHGDDIRPTLMRNKRDVWHVGSQPYSGAHFATFPPKLIEPCILADSAPGDTVLDPFGGSGTTGQVALENSRSALLCELNPTYGDLIRQRCAVTAGLGLTNHSDDAALT